MTEGGSTAAPGPNLMSKSYGISVRERLVPKWAITNVLPGRIILVRIDVTLLAGDLQLLASSYDV